MSSFGEAQTELKLESRKAMNCEDLNEREGIELEIGYRKREKGVW